MTAINTIVQQCCALKCNNYNEQQKYRNINGNSFLLVLSNTNKHYKYKKASFF